MGPESMVTCPTPGRRPQRQLFRERPARFAYQPPHYVPGHWLLCIAIRPTDLVYCGLNVRRLRRTTWKVHTALPFYQGMEQA